MAIMTRWVASAMFVVSAWCGVVFAETPDTTAVELPNDTDIEAAIESGVTDNIDQAVGDAADVARSRTPGGAAFAMDIVSGHRVSRRVITSLGPATMSARWTPLARAASLSVRRIGAVESVVIGGVRARFGEGILLGAASSAYGAPRRSLRTASVDATTSLWDQRRGIGIVMRSQRMRGGVVGWESVGRQAFWGFVERRFGQTTVAGAVGRMDDVHGRGVPAASIALAHVFDGALTACEIASTAGTLLASVRVVSGDGWSAEVFSSAVPGGFGSGVVEPEDVVRRQVGAAMHRGLARGRVSLYSVRRRRDGDEALRRRLEWRMRHPVEHVDIVLRVTDDRSSKRTRYRVDPAATSEHTRTVLGRVRASFAIAPAIDTGWSLSTERGLAGEAPAGTSVVAGWTFDIRAGVFEARVVASSFSLTGGQLGYVSRAGIGGYETGSVVSRQGGEVSVRAGATYRGLRLSGFAGQPHGAPVRVLVALGIDI